jgi:hypothetical protein
MSWLTRKLPDQMKTVPPPADPKATIWRYMKLKAFETLMTDQCLMFHQFKELRKSDEQEGMVTEGFWESLLDFFHRIDPDEDSDKLRQWAEAQLDKLTCFEYASCWIMADTGKAKMWKNFAPGGIAIRTKVGELMGAKQAGSRPQTIRSQIIEYADHWSELEARGYSHCGVPLNRLFLHTKRNKFKDENEIRFRIQPVANFPIGPDGTPRSADPRDCPAWWPVRFETLNWIGEIIAAPSIPSKDAESIQRRVEQKGLSFSRSKINP